MNLKNIENWQNDYNIIVNGFSFYNRPRINTKLNYLKNEQKIIAYVSIFLYTNNYTMKEFLVTIHFKDDGEILHRECFNCDDEVCEHITIACFLLAKNYSDICSNLKIKSDYKLKEIIGNLKRNSLPKEMCNLEISLEFSKNYHNELDLGLNLKIGLQKLYVLRKNINQFLESFISKKDLVIFGKDFTYNPNQHFFNNADRNIIRSFSQVLEKNDYDNSINSDRLSIKEDSIQSFLDLLRESEKNFMLDIGAKKISVEKIDSDFYPLVRLEKNGEGLKLLFDSTTYTPLVEDESYIFFENKIYYLDEEKRSLLNEFRLCKSIIIEEDEIMDFSKYILPNIRKMTENLEIAKELKDKYSIIKPVLKLYFDVNDDDFIICYPKASYHDIEINIMDDNEYLKNNILRDELSEQEAIDYLFSMGFLKHESNPYFIIIEEEFAIKFLKDEIVKLDKFESFISSKLKNIKYIKNPGISSSVRLEEGELLSCEFKISGIDETEISRILDAMRYKRKYFKLKNGSYLNIEESEELEKLDNFITNLDINANDIGKKDITIPKFKALYIALQKDEYGFINTNKELDNFITNFKSYKNKKVKIPTPKNVSLRDYQEQGIKWLNNIANYGFGSILADEMGLGKTLQAIMYCKARLLEDRSREILIVCPTSLIYNWEAEFNQFAPEIKVKVIAEMRKKREKVFDELKNYEIFITSYGLLREDIEKYELVNYDTIIIDEAQAIKNPHAKITKAIKTIKASHKFALTGTPIENSITELYSIFDFIMPGFFGNQATFTKKYNKIMSSDNSFKKEFNKLISPFILRRNKSDVMKELPEKLEKNIVIELEEEQKKVYLAELSKVNKEVGMAIKNNTFKKNKLLILQSLLRLRQVCITPALYIDNYKGGSSKIELLIEMVNEISQNHKILLFSQFTSALDIVAKRLKKEKISYYYLDGSTKAKDRLEMANSFNKDDTKVFLISLKAGGSGLNLIGADTVIHLDMWWNPAVENQATDRAHRIGQKKVVEVIKFICKGTIEEKILKLQGMKKELSKLVLEGKMDSDKMVDKLSEKDILYLLGNE